MNISKYINYLLILAGASIAIYANAKANQNQYVLIGGIVVLMIGLYRISRNLPSKKEQQDQSNSENDEL